MSKGKVIDIRDRLGDEAHRIEADANLEESYHQDVFLAARALGNAARDLLYDPFDAAYRDDVRQRLRALDRLMKLGW